MSLSQFETNFWPLLLSIQKRKSIKTWCLDALLKLFIPCAGLASGKKDDLEQFFLSCKCIVIVFQIGPIHLCLGADAIDILLDVGVAISRAVFIGIRGVVGIKTVGNLPLIEA